MLRLTLRAWGSSFPALLKPSHLTSLGSKAPTTWAQRSPVVASRSRHVASQAAYPREKTSDSGFRNETIYALSSAQGRAGVALIRISGPDCLEVHRRLCPDKTVPRPRYATVRTLFDPESEAGDPQILDSSALVLHFPGPKTVTGEDVLELHTHGGPATVKAVLAAVPKCSPSTTSQIRYAEPGEFTRRAFFNDRLDLAQVESLSDTLDAETEQQRRAAVRGNSGVLGRTYESWRERLLLARGEIEALIDFSEDQHFDESPQDLLMNVSRLVRELLSSIETHEMAGQRSELLRNGIRIALLGPPNVGKSSLMNLIVGREASIVSTEAGTTRDIVEASLDIRGYLCTFADTAGFRSSSSAQPRDASTTMATGASEDAIMGPVEQEGIRRAKSKALDSDVIIVVASIEKDGTTGDNENNGRSYRIRYDEETLRLAAQAAQRIVVINKRDAATTSEVESLTARFRSGVLAELGLHNPNAADAAAEPLTISCVEAAAGTADAADAAADAAADDARASRPQSHLSQSHSPSQAASRPPPPSRPAGLKGRVGADPGGVHTLINQLVRSFESLTSLPADMQDLFGVTERQRQLLARCKVYLEDFMLEAEGRHGGLGPDVVLAAEHLRYAAGCLAAITGRGESGDVEDVLGVIFEKFCVGK